MSIFGKIGILLTIPIYQWVYVFLSPNFFKDFPVNHAHKKGTWICSVILDTDLNSFIQEKFEINGTLKKAYIATVKESHTIGKSYLANGFGISFNIVKKSISN